MMTTPMMTAASRAYVMAPTPMVRHLRMARLMADAKPMVLNP